MKGTFCELFGEFFGQHAVQVNTREKITEGFNQQLETKQLVIGDEISFADAEDTAKVLDSRRCAYADDLDNPETRS